MGFIMDMVRQIKDILESHIGLAVPHAAYIIEDIVYFAERCQYDRLGAEVWLRENAQSFGLDDDTVDLVINQCDPDLIPLMVPQPGWG